MVARIVLAGWASTDITPEVPCGLGGYLARTEQATGVHDPLFAHALAFGAPARPLVLVVCDLLAVEATLVHKIRERVSKTTPEATVWVGATHTHSGPEIGPGIEDRIADRVAQVVKAALAVMRPVTASWASGDVVGVGGNRDHPDRTPDLRLDLLCLNDPDMPGASPLAVLGTFACHPTVLGAENARVSADLPGAFRRQMSSRYTAPVWVALATGAAGDVSTRHLRREQTYQELERLGSVLAERAVTLLDDTQPLCLCAPLVSRRVVRLKAKNPARAADLTCARVELDRRRVALLQAGDARGARTCETALQGLTLRGPTSEWLEVELDAARLGELTLAAVPAELYHALGTRITRRRSPTLLLGYTNGYIGYIPTRSAYDDALDYEVLASGVAPGEGERLAAAAGRLVDDTWRLT
jgi:hypothetical protein